MLWKASIPATSAIANHPGSPAGSVGRGVRRGFQTMESNDTPSSDETDNRGMGHSMIDGWFRVSTEPPRQNSARLQARPELHTLIAVPA